MNDEIEPADFAVIQADWVTKGMYLLHVPTRVIGKAVRLYDGDQVRWKDPNDVLVPAPVIELHNGHAFVSTEPNDFLSLEENEAKFYAGATQDLGTFCGKLMTVAAASGMSLRTGALLLSALLREQARVVDLAGKQMPQTNGDSE